MTNQDSNQPNPRAKKRRPYKLTNYKMVPALIAVLVIAVLVVAYGISRTSATIAPGVNPNISSEIAPQSTPDSQESGPAASSDGNLGMGQTAGTPGARDK